MVAALIRTPPLRINGRAALLGLLFAHLGGASAQPLLADDFEGNLLRSDTPAGSWDSAYVASLSGLTAGLFRFETPAAAAHQGQHGLRVVDAHAGTGSDTTGFLNRDVPAGGSAHFARFWFRGGANNAAGHWQFFDFATTPSAGISVLDIGWDTAGDQLTFICFGAGGPAPKLTAALGSAWRLVEVGLEGEGTATAHCTARVDGQSVYDQVVDLSGVSLNHVTLGSHYADLAITGSFDVDDLEIEATPIADRLTLHAPGLTLGECGPVTVGLAQSFDGGAAARAAPVDFELDGPDGGAVSFWSDSACTVQASGGQLPAGQTEVLVFAKALVPGDTAVAARSSDVLPAALMLTVSADRPNLYAIGCSGSGAPGAGGVLALIALWALSPRRRRARPLP